MTGRSAARPEWTFRRLPWPIARGGLVAAVTAVTCLVLHIGGWDVSEPGWPVEWLPVYAVGLPVALTVEAVLIAPLLRRLALKGRLTRRHAMRLGAVSFGLLTLAWMVLLDVGPPGEVERWVQGRAEAAWAVDAVRLAYNAVLTPLAFAVYGAVSAWAGWRAAFGGREAVDAERWLV